MSRDPRGELRGLTPAQVAETLGVPLETLWAPAEDMPDSAALARYADALSLMVTGQSLAAAARACGHSARSLQNALYRHPEVYRDVKRRQDVTRELLLLRALGYAPRLLDGADAGGKLSVRDIADLIRATRPTGRGTDAQIGLLLDL